MNKYSWGTMVDDYVFLEDVGRRVSEWGRDIVRGGYRSVNHGGRGGGAMNGSAGGSARGRGRARVRGRGECGGHSKRDVLKAQLEIRNIEVDLLPLGMERRKLNQSTWDSKYVLLFNFSFLNILIMAMLRCIIMQKANRILDYRI